MHRHALTDAHWAKLQPLLSRRPQGRKSGLGDRLFVDAVIFASGLGSSGATRPERIGNWKPIYSRFRNWATKDAWAQLVRELQIDVDERASIVDGSTVRAHQDASGCRMVRSRSRIGSRTQDLALHLGRVNARGKTRRYRAHIHAPVGRRQVSEHRPGASERAGHLRRVMSARLDEL